MAESGRSDRRRARGRERSPLDPADEPPVRRPAPSSMVENISAEMDAANRASIQNPAARDPGREISTRPSQGFDKKGRTGTTITVLTNYFKVVSRPDIHLFQYRVDFSPDIEPMRDRRGMVWHHEELKGQRYIFDGTLLYTTNRLLQLEFHLPRRSDQADIKITFRLVGEIESGNPVYNSVVNQIFRRCLSMLKLTQIKRNYFDSEAAENMPKHRLSFWPGYQTTIAYHESGYLLGVDLVHKFLRNDTAYDVMQRILHETRYNPEDLQTKVRNALEGQIVMTEYNKLTYKVDDIAFDETPMSTFYLKKENREVTYIDYYTSRYPGIKIKDRGQYLLVSRLTRRDLNRGDTQPIRLIPELCGMTGIPKETRDNINSMKEINSSLGLAPDRRVQTLMKFRRRLLDNARIQGELNSWGLQFSNELVRCPARLLPGETIHQGQASYKVAGGQWDRNIQKNRYCVSVGMKNWLVIFPGRLRNDVIAFVRLMKQVGTPHNFILPEPVYKDIRGDHAGDYVRAIDDECNLNDYNLILIVLTNPRGDIYNAVKQKTLVDLGIPSQVITHRKFKDERKNMSIATKVAIQVASKLGAEPWRVEIPNAGTNKWMVIGYDTYHDARQRKAVGAFVASTNSFFTRYYSSVEVHSNNEEISPSFRQHMFKSFKAYSQENGRTLPDKIIVYRDGVGAGDIARVKEIELAQLKAACQDAAKELKITYEPGIAFIVVSKKINTRFFSNNGRNVDNPPCGTVVDDVVTLRDRYDFFLVPQTKKEVSVSPTSFNIIADTTGLTPDIHQLLANKLTHIYFNWPGALRIPGPVRYAHKLAYLVGESLKLDEKPIHIGLAKLPYYL